ncbi:MAG TPA: hypothetical protein VFV33_14235, partial [Gemmatimonadaceae bacterium]|nr:hypothetical protein [Gemmatimonadaceae bacterium]
MRRSSSPLLAALAVLAAAPAAAQQQTPAPSPPTTPAPSTPTPQGRGAITWSASLRVRGESWDWFDTTDAGRYEFLGVQARLGAAQQRPRLGWRVELEAPLLAGLPDDAVLPAPRGQLGLGASYYAANDNRRSVASVF